MSSLKSQLELAVQHHKAGQTQQAETLYRLVLVQEPNHPDALHLLGVICMRRGEHQAALELIRRAIAVYPNVATYHGNLGLVLFEMGRFDEAAEAYQKALSLNPGGAEMAMGLGNVLRAAGRADQATAAFRQAVAAVANDADACNELGIKLNCTGREAESIEAFRRAIMVRPNFAEAMANLATALANKGNMTEAESQARRALAIQPNLPAAHSALGKIMNLSHRVGDSITAYEQAAKFEPNAFNLSNLGYVLMQAGEMDRSLEYLQGAMRADPANAAYHSTWLFMIQCRPNFSAADLLAESRRWNDLHIRPLMRQIQPYVNDRSPNRKLRIGYISADFRTHSVGYFFMPLLENRDRANFEIFCYASVKQPDATTGLMKQRCDVWRDIVAFSDETVASLIRSDGIDILVDLSGHTVGNRLRVLARKPAPIQVTYLGYANTTGMSVIDYRLTDLLADPPGMTDAFNAEKLWRLPGCAWCYQPPDDVPEPQTLPEGPPTFGCFNSFAKINPPLLDLWTELLNRLPESRLIMKSAGAAGDASQKRLLGQFAERGVPGDRLEIRGMIPDMRTHLSLYDRVDVALDTYPYHGTTTTCEALWMGVPVVSLAGQTHMSRVGVSLLTRAGFPEFIARLPEEYLSIASKLAASPQRDRLRADIRSKMRSSPLADGKLFTKEIESAFRQMWQNWVQKCV